METKIAPDVAPRLEAPSYSVPGACAVVIFGASGDLTARKLMPALYALAEQKLLPQCFATVGVARRELGPEGFRQRMREAVARFSRLGAVRDDVWAPLAESMHYLATSFEASRGYGDLRRLLAEVDQRCGTAGNRLFYLATPPAAYAGIVRSLGEAGLVKPDGKGWTRIILEKPFGHDLGSARDLNRQVLGVFREPQVYRIDHYLGKETVQNILAFRFGNSIFEPLWNRRYIDHVQITVAEDLGAEGRGEYYDAAGALRDMVQNHMLQLLSLVAMEPPAAFGAEAIRDEKVKLLRAVRRIPRERVRAETVRGQYTAGRMGQRALVGYRDEPGVARDSTTETYAALRLTIDNWRWAGVPFYLRTGKALARRITEVTIQYREPPLLLFQHAPHPDHEGPQRLEPNRLSLRIQPDERIMLRFGLKPPGERMSLAPMVMDFGYREGFGAQSPEAYERLLLDAMLGDASLFLRGDEAEAAWALVTPILEGWESEETRAVATYPAGSWGPHVADAFIDRDGRQWVRF
jgi:glucose-6-phosphate 1-dehydrogenase